MSFDRRRNEFPTLASGIHLLSHSLGPVPRAVRESMLAYCDAWEHHTSEDAWATSWWELSRRVGDRIARILGGSPGSVQIEPNASIALATVASCFHFQSGRRNKVVTTALDFPSMEYIWDAQRQNGARVDVLTSADGISVPLEKILEAIDDETCLVALAHTSYRSSYRVDAAAIVERAHAKGALVLLDVYQSAGVVPLHAADWKVDFLIGGTIKWLCGGPSCGYLYVRPEIQKDLRPRLTGWVAHDAPFEPGDSGFINGQAGVAKQWANFAPRVAVAWDPLGDGKTSVRAGYGMNSEFVNGQFYINTSNAPPWGSEVRLTAPNIGPFENPFAGTGVPNIFPIAFDKNAPFSLNGPYLAPPSDLSTTRVHSYNLSVQRQFGANTAVSATYLGNKTNHLWDVVTGNPGIIPAGGSPTGPCTINTLAGPQVVANCSTASLDSRRELTQLNPATGRFIGFLDYFTDHGTQTYNGLLLSVQKRTANGYSVSSNYTISKCEGHPTQGGSTPNVGSGYMMPVSLVNPPANADALLDLDYGPCDNDRRHIFNLSATAQTPDFSGAAMRALVSGWRLSGIFRALSGSPFSVTTGLDRSLTGNPGQQRANVSGDPYLKQGTTWLNPAAFSQPALGTFGNSGRNQFYGPGTKGVDLSLVRAFTFGTQRAEARIEAFNAFNWTRFNGLNQQAPATNPLNTNILNNANFGRILGAGDPRIMQFALKYEF